MSEIEPQSNLAENEKPPLDQRLRSIASELGFVETPKVQAMLNEALENADVRPIIDAYENELEDLRQDNPNAAFLAAAALFQAVIHIAAHNTNEAYNNLADAYDILNGEGTHPEVLSQIEALMIEL